MVNVSPGLHMHYIIPSSSYIAPCIDPERPTVVLLHPRFFDSHFFGPQYRDSRLAKGYNLVAIDHHYHGQTIAPLDDKPYNCQKVAKDVLAAMDALKIKQAHLLGNCLGAQIATYMAMQAPKRIQSLTLMSQDPPVEDSESTEQFIFLRNSCYAKADDGSDQLASDVVHGLHWIYFGDDPSAQPVIDEWVASSNFRPSNPKLITKVFSSLVDSEPMAAAAWDNISCPVLMIHGNADVPSPSTFTRDFYETIRSTQRELHIIEDGPHFLSYTHHAEVNQLIADFLDRVTGTDSKAAALAPRRLSRRASDFVRASETRKRGLFERITRV